MTKSSPSNRRGSGRAQFDRVLLAAHADPLTRAALGREQPQAANGQIRAIAFFEDAQELAPDLAGRAEDTNGVAAISC